MVSDPSATPGPPPPVRAVLAALGPEPLKLLVVGGIGTGKSTALEGVRRALREAGQTVVARVPGPQETDGAAVVVDDAHLLSETDLRALAELADDPVRTVVVAAESRNSHPALRGLGAALEREHARITLGPLYTGEISRTLADPSGHPPSPELLAAALAATAGIPFLVAALAASPRPLSREGMDQAAGFALIERLRRLDQQELETLLIASLSTDLGATDLTAALDVPGQRSADLVDRARGTGLVEPSHAPEFLRRVHRAAAQVLGTTRHHDVERALLATQLESATLSLQLAVELAEHGVRDDALARWLHRHAATFHGDPTERVRIHRAAVNSGAADLRAGLADALALSDDCPAASALADVLLGSHDAAERAAGVRIGASVAAHDGNYTHAAELFDWLGPYPDATVGAAAAIVHTATGDGAAARAALEVAHAGPPTAAARAARSLAEGIIATIDRPYPAAAARLGQSVAGGHTAATLVMPDSAAALVTLAAIHSGDSVRARSVIGRAVREGGEPVFAARHRLLQGWVRMQDGQLTAAAAGLDAIESSGLRGRDALWAAALRTAIARRGGDTGALQTQWFTGMDVLAEYSIDLFSLLPVGEMWMAAARLRQQDRLAAVLEQAFAVLGALGEPVAWSPLLHWAGVHAGILANDPAAVAPHGQALTTLAEQSPFAAALAAAGGTWLRVLANQVDPEEVIAAARGLAQFGLTSDATRLAGQAALQAQDPKVSGLMLQVARDLKAGTGDAAPDPAEPAPAGRPRPVSAALSDREREVAELLLLGMPYRDIGAQLFISAKTVEHHVARIRRRLGAESRSDMLSMLRALLTPDGAPAPGS